MNIGIIGAGHVGGTIAQLFIHAGHRVALSNSRGPRSLTSLVATLGPNARAATVAEAVRIGDVVLLALPWRERGRLPPASLFAGKIVIDATNPYSTFGRVVELGNTTSSEEMAKQLPGARVVKAFNTLNYSTLATGAKSSEADRLVLFLAGDDGEAKSIVANLIFDIGFAPVDTGSLRTGGRRQQPGSLLYDRPLSTAQAHDALGKLP